MLRITITANVVKNQGNFAKTIVIVKVMSKATFQTEIVDTGTAEKEMRAHSFWARLSWRCK